MRVCFPIGLVCLFVACAPDPCEVASDYTPSVLVGTGENTFQAVNPTTVLTQTWGPQGGTHVWGSVQTVGLNPGLYKPLLGGEDVLSIEMSIVSVESSQEVGWLQSDQIILDGEVESAELAGLTIFTDTVPDSFYEQTENEVLLSVIVTDACQTTVTDSRPAKMSLDN